MRGRYRIYELLWGGGSTQPPTPLPCLSLLYRPPASPLALGRADVRCGRRHLRGPALPPRGICMRVDALTLLSQSLSFAPWLRRPSLPSQLLLPCSLGIQLLPPLGVSLSLFSSLSLSLLELELVRAQALSRAEIPSSSSNKTKRASIEAQTKSHSISVAGGCMAPPCCILDTHTHIQKRTAK